MNVNILRFYEKFTTKDNEIKCYQRLFLNVNGIYKEFRFVDKVDDTLRQILNENSYLITKESFYEFYKVRNSNVLVADSYTDFKKRNGIK